MLSAVVLVESRCAGFGQSIEMLSVQLFGICQYAW